MNELRDLCIHALQAAVNAAQPYQRVRDVSLIWTGYFSRFSAKLAISPW